MLASGILAEIGTITTFDSHNALAQYAGLTWRVKQSGNYSADDTRMTKTGNRYLRYYLIEAANSVKNHIPEYKEYYYKKFGEVTCHQHKRALAFTARKLVWLIFSLLTKNQIYFLKNDPIDTYIILNNDSFYLILDKDNIYLFNKTSNALTFYGEKP
ncbi:MAG: IS110 family transposase [Tepidanaerobacter acetatoxydans]|nr:IS110 family transposase [Tepidanaerobacter acetatoxydans]